VAIDSLTIDSLTIVLRLPVAPPPIVNDKIGNRQFWGIDSLTIALRPPGVPPPIVNEKIGNRQSLGTVAARSQFTG
jgi:hypothetical protein